MLLADVEDEKSTKYQTGRESYWIHQLRTLTPWGINIHT